MHRLRFLILFLLGIGSAQAQTTEIIFDIFLKEKVIGKVHATEKRTGTEVVRDVKSESDATVVVVSVHVETDTKVTSGNEVQMHGEAYRHSNRGPKDIHATTRRLSAKKYERDRDGEKSIFEGGEITFSVADLFFKEPVGLKKIYSNMFAEMVELKSLGRGKYEVTSPEGKATVYTYDNGKLVTVESETPAGVVISKRVRG